VANELKIFTGIEAQAVRAYVASGAWTTVTTSLACASAGPGGLYAGTFPVGVTTADTYEVVFHASGSVDNILGAGQIVWNGSAEVDDINNELDKPMTELAQAAPSATPTLRNGIMLMYMALRNRVDVKVSTTNELAIYNNAGTKIARKQLTDDGTDYLEVQMSSGA